MVIIFVVPFHYYRYQRSEKSLTEGLFNQLYDGIKTNRPKTALFFFFFGVRRILMAIVVVLLATTLSFYIKMGFYCLIQIGYVSWLALARPYEEWHENLCEIVQDLVFIIIIVLHTCWQTEAAWPDSRTSLALNIIMASGLIVAFVMVVAALVSLIKALVSKCNKKSARNKQHRKSEF